MFVGENIVFRVWKIAIRTMWWIRAYFVRFVKEIANVHAAWEMRKLLNLRMLTVF